MELNLNSKVPGDLLVSQADGSPASLENLIHGDLSNDAAAREEDVLISSCILTPKNAATMELNRKVVDLFHGQSIHYLSADTTKDVDDQVRATNLYNSGFTPLELQVYLEFL